MINLIFEQADGVEKSVAAKVGTSLMEIAIANDIDGVVATCNGSLTCGTCHVFLAAEAFSSLDAPDEFEDDLLDFAEFEREPYSRLSCQIIVVASMDGMRIRVPENQ